MFLGNTYGSLSVFICDLYQPHLASKLFEGNKLFLRGHIKNDYETRHFLGGVGPILKFMPNLRKQLIVLRQGLWLFISFDL